MAWSDKSYQGNAPPIGPVFWRLVAGVIRSESVGASKKGRSSFFRDIGTKSEVAHFIGVQFSGR
ncbi:hypothetical protein BLX90_17565 [Rhizobium sp. Y9]|nr:hypothetical protein BLX90_17565 [Rhizobium sp. Y9]PTV68808.1 hypothetical protein DBL06_26495 [Agrobacterium pusense]